MPSGIDDHITEISDPMSENEDESEIYNRDEDKMAESSNTDSNGAVKKKYDPKDPSRPRRKKARRACFACQRAHLTCGKFPWAVKTSPPRPYFHFTSLLSSPRFTTFHNPTFSHISHSVLSDTESEV